MNAFLDLAARRYSCRAYTGDPVCDSDLDKVLEAGQLAPTAVNRQAFTIVVVRDPDRRRAVGEAYPKAWLQEAPIILVVCVEPAAAWTRRDGVNFAAIDGAIVMDHLTLCATDLGLGTCWCGVTDERRPALHAITGIPADLRISAMVRLGYPGEQKEPRSQYDPAKVYYGEYR